MPTYPIRRRPRECKTCLPCRASKVRCDRNVPCGNCVKRNFTCSYGRPPPTAPRPASFIADQYGSSATTPATNTPQYMPSAAYQPAAHRDPPYGAGPESASSANQDGLSEMVTLSQEEWDEINSKMQTMEQILTSLGSLFQAHGARKAVHSRSELSQEQEEEDHSPASEGIYGSTTLRTNSVHIGSRSALVDILDKSKVSEDTAQALPKDDLLTELAMGNESAAYPFVDLWSSDPYTFNISGVCSVLPDDEQCRKFLAFYRNIGAVLYPVLPDLDKFERDMDKLLQGRQAAGGVYNPDANGLVKPFGMSVSFLSLLFAILASGSQLSDLPGKERELTSWVYVSCSYHCLRMLNYVSQPSLEVIQILLIIGSVLSYNMNAGASYTLLGMTERMCMVLGLHVETSGFPRATQAARRRVWWAMAFQNSHFSLAYDRPSITMINQPEIPYDPKSMPGHRGYFETLCRLIQVVLDMLRGLMFTHHTHLRYHEIREYKQRIERIIAEAAPHLKSRERCATLGEHIERTELRLHSSWFISLMCRVSLDPDTPMDEQRREVVREDCLTNLINTIEAFIELHSINSHASRTWISLQRTIASAFLLVANNNDQLHPQTWDLIQKLEAVLSDHVHGDESSDHNSKTDSAKHLASSLHALREVSAAFRARKLRHRVVPKVVPNMQNTSPATSFASPSSTLGSGMPTYSSDQSVSPDGHIDNILNQVSDVMLFPSMSSGNA
ncbi:Fungal specific transcription factor domain family protein [Aspergillus niger]|uniref:Fungal specific transcription factor domain family protein n=2 Tax=Aspergillus niger TaxID=5061 RepID=A0A505I9U3_ASPNG|nr:fungal-specific transcription factor [Aspergillus niger CBS 101883]PYH56007.1 fungal-specific transcription factor [Aspergillus niger CBS 101883]RDH17093.1 fungal-specific transcription factor [Aspergillus niger ATCC 13496]TPR06082.1 Fungal specific transcription factor domain family protein [Aspergillus niger]